MRVRLFFVVSWLVLFALPASAMTRMEFEELVQSGNFEAVETYIAKVDQEVIASQYADNNRLRKLFELFQKTRPEITTPLMAWGETHPYSMYQEIALGWHLQHLSAITRGESKAEFTHKKARERVHAYNSQIDALTNPAFAIRQDFVPLNDLIAFLLRHGGSEEAILNFADQALAANPSYGLLTRLRTAAFPKWSGSGEAVDMLCHDWAEKVKFHDGYNAEICVVQTYSRDELRQILRNPDFNKYINDLLDRTEPPMLDFIRTVVWEHDPARYVEWKAAVIRNFNPNSFVAISNVNFFAAQRGIPELRKMHMETMRAVDAARHTNAPYNPNLIEPKISLIRGEYMSGQLTTQQRADIREQIYGALPYGRYSPEIWLRAAGYLRDYGHPGLIRPEELPFYRKAVVASNYNPAVLSILYNALVDRLMVSYMEDQGIAPALAIAPERAKELINDEQRKKLEENAKSRDWLICPFVQTRYLLLQSFGGRFSNMANCTQSFHEDPESYWGKRIQYGTLCPTYELKKSFSPGFNEDLDEELILPTASMLEAG